MNKAKYMEVNESASIKENFLNNQKSKKKRIFLGLFFFFEKKKLPVSPLKGTKLLINFLRSFHCVHPLFSIFITFSHVLRNKNKSYFFILHVSFMRMGRNAWKLFVAG